MNEPSNLATKNFGWVRNGGFELDVKPGELVNEYFGWSWSDDVPDLVDSGYIPNTPGTNYQHNITTYQGYQERVPEGTYSFKWGDTDHYIETNSLPSGGYDFIGTL